ncbi:multicopper oxidase domain-containing protein [Streptomyces sp. AV19]|uniref:multicopper oxidase family protein n=1 Tax=Streptomyces sp. AV19 TaxID=2793068 RepID=UPI0018FEE331|nr:multicopper oxidase family protein [Streptomyces sp. AV19]MBH1933378.1 multicopper oxidase domain-containing protein [Streptomyces sp. AV19]MDG4531989.1 multicopper oxidase family protein [Streptomyces sp. AV19]
MLRGVGALGAGGALAGLAGAAAGPDAAGTTTRHDDGPPLRDLPQVSSRAGRLDHTLAMATTRADIGGRRLRLDTYNNGLPGGILRIRPGDRVRILLRNRMVPSGLLPACDGQGHKGTDCLPRAKGLPEVHDLRQDALATNLHVHGLQVSPSGHSDNMDVRVDPGDDFQYVYDVPEDQPAGLHWYHPHHHGSTTHQAWSGLSGPIVVEGDIDRVPEIAAMRERTIVVSSLRVDGHGENPTDIMLPAGDDDGYTALPGVHAERLYPLNGLIRPVARIRPGETQRWRVLNAVPHRELWLHVEGHTLHWIGADGIPFGRTRPVPSVMLAPGNRAEFVLRGGKPGRYRVYAAAYHPGGGRAARPALRLGTLEVTGRKASGRVPGRLVAPRRLPGLPVARHRTLVLSRDNSGHHGPGPRFLVNGRLFDMDRVDVEAEAGTVEEWRFVNDDSYQHPMHIHVNPFQVVGTKGIPRGDASWYTDPGIWWDTHRLPPHGELTLRTYFRPDAPGRTVFHCHVLPHEDHGTMANLLITPPCHCGGTGEHG